jgi:putative methyltransferase (TIGR04325 family)
LNCGYIAGALSRINMKNIIRHLTVPLFVRLVKHHLQPPRWHDNYQDALQASQQDGYENGDVVDIVVRKNQAYRQRISDDTVLDFMAVRTLIGIGLAKTSDHLRVIDFGGGGGNHFTVAERALGKGLQWCVVETTAMAEAAQSIQTDGLTFTDDLETAVRHLGQVDLVFTSGALQYCPDPLSALQQLIDVGARYLYITRTELTERARAMYTVQRSRLSSNGPGPMPSGTDDKPISYPITYASRQAFEAVLTKAYNIRFAIDEEGDNYRVGDKSIRMRGYFCELKTG